MAVTTINLSAAANVDIRLAGGAGGSLIVTVTSGGSPVNLTEATIVYVAGSISKSVGSGITITDANGGQFHILFTPVDTTAVTHTSALSHRCTLALPGDQPRVLFSGKLIVEV